MAPEKLQAWRREYNEIRPRPSLDNLSPWELKARWAEKDWKFTNELAQEMGGLRYYARYSTRVDHFLEGRSLAFTLPGTDTVYRQQSDRVLGSIATQFQ